MNRLIPPGTRVLTAWAGTTARQADLPGPLGPGRTSVGDELAPVAGGLVACAAMRTRRAGQATTAVRR